MALKIKKRDVEEFVPIETLDEGVYEAVCIGVFDVGYQFNAHYDKTQRKIFVFFEVDEVIKQEGQFLGKRYLVNQEFTLSLHSRAQLRRVLESWTGALDVTDDDLRAVDYEDFLKTLQKELVGLGAQLTIGHNKSKETDRVFANIMAVTPLSKKSKPLEIENVKYEMPKWVDKIFKKKVEKPTIKQEEV